MSHFLEEYAKALGVRASKPVVQDHFFPLVATKYITISNEDDLPAKQYAHYPLVLELLKPVLQAQDIKVIQIGGKIPIDGIDQILNLSFRQQCFILGRSLLHLGCDGVLSHAASSKKIPTINLYGNIFPTNNRPLFSPPSLNINLAPEWDIKPSFNREDPKREINKIKPETVAQSALDLLGIQKKVGFSTLHVGAAFGHKILEIVPSSFVPLNTQQNFEIFLRPDYGFNEESFLQYCRSYKVSIITDQLIQPHALTPVASNINKMGIFVGPEWEEGGSQRDHIPDGYFNLLKNHNIECVLLVTNPDHLGVAQNTYFDQVVKPYRTEKNNRLENLPPNARFFSSKYVVDAGKQYLSYAHWKKRLDSNDKVLDNEDYWEELEHFYIYEQN
jgi:hypothetical protein